MKGLNLTDTSIREFYIHVRDSGVEADVWYLGEIYDDLGNLVKSERVDTQFSLLSMQIKAALNNAMRLISREFNNDQVAEDTETWNDI